MRRLVVLLPPLAAIILILVFWHVIAWMLAALLSWRVFKHVHHKGRKHPPQFAKNVQALGVAYAAWNSRWLNPKTHAKVHAGTPGTVETDEGVIPF